MPQLSAPIPSAVSLSEEGSPPSAVSRSSTSSCWSHVSSRCSEKRRERRLVDHLRAVLEQLERQRLDRVGVGKVLAQLLGEVVPGDIVERGLDGPVEEALDSLHHRPLLVADLPGGLRDFGLAGPVGTRARRS